MGTDDNGWTTFESAGDSRGLEQAAPSGPPQPMEGGPWAPPTPSTPLPTAKRRREIPVWAIVIAVVVGVLIVVGVISNNTSSDTGKAKSSGDPYVAHAMCAEFTRDQLKAPASADFPEYDDPGVSVTHNGDTWTVSSFVDAENSFGADIRTSFTCVARDLGEQWRLIRWTEN